MPPVQGAQGPPDETPGGPGFALAGCKNSPTRIFLRDAFEGGGLRARPGCPFETCTAGSSGRLGRRRRCQEPPRGSEMNIEVEKEPGYRPNEREKTLRAFRAYLALLDTCEWIRGETRGQLEAYGLTVGRFRVLEIIYREGPQHINAIARGCQTRRQNADVMLKRLEEDGWLEREVVTLDPVDNCSNRRLKTQGTPRKMGRRVTMMRLTPLGEKFIGKVFPKHAKIIKSLMRVLDGREQETLERTCRKLIAGDPIKYYKELRFEDVDEVTETWPQKYGRRKRRPFC